MQKIDRRADYIAISRPSALDRINDIQAAADEGRRQLDRAWRTREADWQVFFHWMVKADETLQGIRRIGNDWAGEVSNADSVPLDQISLWEAAAAA